MNQEPPRRLIPVVNSAACRGCKRCLGVRVCPTGALEDSAPGHPPTLHAENCEGCLECVSSCPVGGLTVTEIITPPPPET